MSKSGRIDQDKVDTFAFCGVNTVNQLVLGIALQVQQMVAGRARAGRTFGGVVVTNYLWRPLLSTIIQSVEPGGVLLYETFAIGNETVGRPARPEFLLQPGELLTACATLQVVAYENGFLDTPARFVQRIAAVRMPEQAAPPARHPLHL